MTKEQEVFKFLRSQTSLGAMSDEKLRDCARKLVDLVRRPN